MEERRTDNKLLNAEYRINMTKKENFKCIVEELKKIYPDATCALEFGGEPWKLLGMGRLSAQ